MTAEPDARLKSARFDVYAVPDQGEIVRRKRASRKRKSTETQCVRCEGPSGGEIRCTSCDLDAAREAREHVERFGGIVHTRDGKTLRVCRCGARLIGRGVRVVEGKRRCTSCGTRVHA